jgi:N-acyl-D-aspartate/D-glutamate deacylase
MPTSRARRPHRGIGKLGGHTANTRLDAHGKIVAPRFIDAHTYDDLALQAQPGCARCVAYLQRKATAAGIEAIRAHVREAMDAGAVGVPTGTCCPPAGAAAAMTTREWGVKGCEQAGGRAPPAGRPAADRRFGQPPSPSSCNR